MFLKTERQPGKGLASHGAQSQGAQPLGSRVQGKSAQADMPSPGGFSRREMRQINSGRQPIEARLDLHGLVSRSGSYGAAQFSAAMPASGPAPCAGDHWQGAHSSRKCDLDAMAKPSRVCCAVLFPCGLANQTFVVVSGFSQAPRRHGGEGALYVRLRRNLNVMQAIFKARAS